MYLKHGTVNEVWETDGNNITYKKSTLKREGWRVPGPVNRNEEDIGGGDNEDIVMQSNLDIKLFNEFPSEGLLKRSFYQMDFELEFPYNNDTVYIAYSRPYPYSKVLASMFAIEERL